MGKQLHVATSAPPANDPVYTVAGAAQDVKNSGLAESEEPEYYRLRRNQPDDWDRNAFVIVKTTLPPGTIEPWIYAQVAALDSTVPVEVKMLSERVDRMASL